MDMKELDLYREIAAMTQEVFYSYSIEEDIMTMYKGDSANKGVATVINNYVAMLKRQNYSEEYKENINLYLEALSTGSQSFFEYEIKAKLNGYQENCYRAVGKTVYNDNNEAVSVIGKMYPVEENDSDDVINKLDRSTGVIKTKEFRELLAKKYEEHDGRVGGFLLLSLTDVHRPTGDNFEAEMKKLYVNIAQSLARHFSYNAIIGRLRKDEFSVVYFGRDISGEFLSRVEDLKSELDELVGDTLMNAGLRVCGGVTCEKFENNKQYIAFVNAGKAMDFAKYTGENAIWIYTDDLGEVYRTYRSEDKRLKTAQMKLEHKLIQNTFTVLSETKDVKKTIFVMFDIVGKAYNLDRISMYEISNTAEEPTIYTWEKEEQCQCYANRQMPVNLEVVEWLNKQVKMAVVPDAVKVESDDPLYGVITDKIKAFVMTGYSVGNVSGCISFECHENKRRWTAEELNIFELIKRTISTSLITVRLYNELVYAQEESLKYDALTGLYKYTVFLEEANKYIATHADEKLAVVSLRLDGFVRVNQFYGYTAGDEVLKGYASILKNDKQRFIMGCRLNADNLVGLMRLFDSRGSMISEATAGVMYGEFLREMSAKYPAVQMDVKAGMCRVDGNGMGIADYIEAADKIKTR